MAERGAEALRARCGSAESSACSWIRQLKESITSFHRYRLLRDGRILFGGYDAVYAAAARSRFVVCSGSALAARALWAAARRHSRAAPTRRGTQVALNLLDGRESEATRLRFVRTRPLPFPPEPLRSGHPARPQPPRGGISRESLG